MLLQVLTRVRNELSDMFPITFLIITPIVFGACLVFANAVWADTNVTDRPDPRVQVMLQPDSVRTAEGAHIFLWAATEVVPRYDVEVSGKLVACVIKYRIIYDEEDVALESFNNFDYTLQIFAFGGWGSTRDLATVVRDHATTQQDCNVAVTR